MRFIQETDEGVSPVVGVILMVAITVILAALIATFVLGLGGTVNQNPQAGVSFDQNYDGSNYDVDVQVVSMENADYITVSDSAGVASSEYTGDFTDTGDDGSKADNLDAVAETGNVDKLSDGDKLTVTATLEGKTQVIQTYTVQDR